MNPLDPRGGGARGLPAGSARSRGERGMSMARQFRLIDVRPSADGRTVTATVADADWTRFTEPPADVQVLPTPPHFPYAAVVRFPARKLVCGNILDFDR